MLVFIHRPSSSIVLFLVLLALCFHNPVLKVQAVSREPVNGEFKNDIPENNDEIEKNFYKAAVVEYAADDHPNDFTAEQILFYNVENFEKFMREAGLEGTDIIVFPEYGLTSLTFTRGNVDSSEVALIGKRERLQPYLQYIPEIGQNPCQIPGSSEVIKRISCASAENRIYTVINLGEIVPCNDNATACPVDGNFHFNTAVAFDRDGTIVAKYHKYNLFGEPQFDAAPFPEFSSFLTDFGVEFGVFICFDLLFEVPAKALVSRGIRHFVFPTAWVDELPFLTAIQAQSFWASSSSATLLASGYHSPGFGKLGSGIYSESGKALNYTFDPDSGTKIVYAQVPITKNIQEQKKPSGILSQKSTLEEKQMILTKQNKAEKNSYAKQTHWYYRENLTNYTTIPIPMPEKTKIIENGTEQSHENISICDKEFCCELTYTLTKSTNFEKRSMCESETEIIMEGQKIRKVSFQDEKENDEITTITGNQYKDSSTLDLSSAHYRLIVINQPRKFSSPIVVQEMNLQVCGVVRCLNESVQSCAENYRPSSSNEENIPNFSFLQLKASPFSIPTKPNDHEINNDDDNILPHSKPTFTSLDIYFKLIPPHLLNVDYTEDSQSLTLTSAEILDVPIQTLTLFNVVYTKSAA